MINVNEILKKHNPDYVLHGANVLHSSQILKSVKEIVEEVLKEAADKAELVDRDDEDVYRNTVSLVTDNWGNIFVVSKNSILDVAKQVKYE